MKPPFRLVKKLPLSRRRGVLWEPVSTRDALYISDDKKVFKFDLRSLQQIWSIPAKRFKVIASVGDLILLWWDGLRAVRPTGEEVWAIRPGRKWKLWRSHQRLLVVAGNGIDVLDISTAKTVGRLDLPTDIEFQALFGDLLIVSKEQRGDPIRAYDLATGGLLWDRNLLDEIRASYGVDESIPAITFAEGSPGRYVATRAAHTLGGSLEDGRPFWCGPEHGVHYVPNVRDGRIYMLSEKNLATHFVALDEATGMTIYDVPLTKYGDTYPTRLGRAFGGVMFDEYIAYPTESSVLVVFRLSDGEAIWHYWHDASLYGGVTDGKRLYVSADDGNVLVFEGAEGG